MTPAELAVNVEVADEEDIEAAIAKVLGDAGITLDELKADARSGRFRSEDARLAWFVISPFVAAEPAT